MFAKFSLLFFYSEFMNHAAQNFKASDVADTGKVPWIYYLNALLTLVATKHEEFVCPDADLLRGLFPSTHNPNVLFNEFCVHLFAHPLLRVPLRPDFPLFSAVAAKHASHLVGGSGPGDLPHPSVVASPALFTQSTVKPPPVDGEVLPTYGRAAGTPTAGAGGAGGAGTGSASATGGLARSSAFLSAAAGGPINRVPTTPVTSASASATAASGAAAATADGQASGGGAGAPATESEWRQNLQKLVR